MIAGSTHTLDTRLKISVSRKGIGLGVPKPSRSVEHKINLSLAARRRTKENSSRWKGGISFENNYAKLNWQRFYKKNKEKRAKYQEEWRDNNREKTRYLNNKYVSLRRGAQGEYKLEEWEALKQKNNYSCLHCGRQEPAISLTIDHIQPISKGGSNYLSNIQPLCRSCNSIKGGRN